MDAKSKKVKADPSSRRALRDEKNNEKMKQREMYLEDKRRLLKLEETNYDKLYLLRTFDGWWKMFGNSALIYKYTICENMLKTDVRLLADTDYYVQSKTGYISIKNIDDLENRLKKLKIYRLRSTERGKVFELGFSLTEQDIVLMQDEEEMRIERANTLITTSTNVAGMNQKIKELIRELYAAVRLMDGVARDVFGNEMVGKAIKLKAMTVRVQRGTVKEDDYFKLALSTAEDLYGYMANIIDLRLLNSKKIFSLTQRIVDLEKQIKKEVNKRAIKKAEGEMYQMSLFDLGEELNDQESKPKPKLSKKRTKKK